MRIALIGQPNCGKSTLFNQVAGYKAETGNFSGTTVTFTETKVRVQGQVVNLVDLPGTYTLAASNPAEREVFTYLAGHEVDIIINVIDAVHLSQSLELTLELLELQRPMVIALNMLDEARMVGLQLDGPGLGKLVGTPVLPLVASKGQGVRNLFVAAVRTAQEGVIPIRQAFSPDIEGAVDFLMSRVMSFAEPLCTEAAVIKLLEGDAELTKALKNSQPEMIHVVEDLRLGLQHSRSRQPVWVISGERHARANEIADMVTRQGERRVLFRDHLDNILLHPVLGYLALVLILFLFFQFVYHFGTLLEEPLLNFFIGMEGMMLSWLGEGFFSQILVGLIQGISGGIAIVLPYLMPFLFGLGLLEDIGYLPRVAFLMDALMHRIGLHGKAIVPFILGFGCNVPAVMSTRIMEDRRDRFIAAALATLVPCAARLSVVFGLVAFYLGPNLALAIYLFNLVVISLTARLLSLMMPEETPGLILEIPVYRLPTFRTVAGKAWFRIREFVVEAWPVLIAGSIVLSILNYFNWAVFINSLVRPLSWLLGLPAPVGVPLIFGILRKELSLVMLHQALQVTDLSTKMTSVQMVTFAVFVVFYIPCLATMAVLRRELGARAMALIASLTVIIAMLAALAARGAALLFL
ncbi:MAG: ferrous iron transport protein B [Anaerolineaceae bacterium]|nr:ferrous iron transport protein B [Anaerolineaceae bacterium]